jgi:hypothetical protein
VVARIEAVVSSRVVILGGVAPVEVVIPDPKPDPGWREVLRSVEAKVSGSRPGAAIVFTELELCALSAGIELVREKSERLSKIQDILRGVDERVPRRR